MYPKISIITPSLNQEQYIEETILSIKNQNYSLKEHIVMDGGSVDESINIIKKYEKSIDYWISEKDNGQSHAINKGLKMAKGDFATWINSDDLLAPNALLNLIQEIEKVPDADIYTGLPLFLNLMNEIEDKSEAFSKRFSFAYHIAAFPYVQPASFFRLKTVKDLGYLDESFEVTMDMDLFVKIILNGGVVHRFDKPIGILRLQPLAKTYTFTQNWEKERIKYLSKLLRSINNNSELIDKVRKVGLYEEGEDVYVVKIKISKILVNDVVKIFIADHSMLFFWNNRFKDCFIFLNKISKTFPEYMNNRLNITKYKSLLSIFHFTKIILNINLTIFRFFKKSNI